MGIFKSPTLQKLGVGLILLAGFGLLYHLTRTDVHTFDALSYSHDVETKPLLELYHPHHLLYGVVGRAAWEGAQLFGYTGRADRPIQALNALAGAVGLLLLWRVGGGFTGRRWLPLGVSLLIGLCYAYWLYAAEVEVYTFAAAFLSASLLLLTLIEQKPSPRLAVLLGMAHAGAVMFHQTNALFTIPVTAFLLVKPNTRRLIIPYGAVLAVCVGIPYIGVALSSGFRTPEAVYHWLTDYAQQGTWGGNLSSEGLRGLRDGLLNTISLQKTPAVAFYALMLVSVGLGWRRLRSAWGALAVSWLALYGGFFWWWEPWNIEFWIALLPLWALLLMVGWGAEARLWRDGLLLVGMLGLSAWLLAAHLNPILKAGDSAQDSTRQAVTALQPMLAASDIVITRGDILDLYLPYYAGFPPSQVWSLREMHQRGESLITRLPALRHAYNRGQLIYIEAMVLDELADPQRNPFGLTAEEHQRLQTDLMPDVALFEATPAGFYALGKRTPPDQFTWSFENHLGGWLEFGADSPRFEDGRGWCMTGGGDPWIESPPLRLPAEAYTRVVITMRLDGEAESGQLYWRREGEGLDESRSLSFPLQAETTRYELDLAGREGWTGEIAFLRLDPIPGGTTTTACLESIVFEDVLR